MNDTLRRIFAAFLVACIALPLLTTCGKKGRLEDPPGEVLEYPRKYPDPDK